MQEVGTLRAMTWNTWWRFGGNWAERQVGILQVVREQEPDLLGIQECWAEAERTQADAIAEELGGHAAFVPTGLPPAPEPAEYAEQENVAMGLGLVSRWPITRILRAALPSEGRDNAALLARVAHPEGPLRVVVGATSWEPDRTVETTLQVAALQRLVREDASSRALPSLLLADLNYDRSQQPLKGVLLLDAWDAADEGADPRTLSSTNRFAPPEAVDQYDRRIDHILFTPGYLGARARRTWIVRDEPGGLPPSDHYPVVTEIGWSTSGT